MKTNISNNNKTNSKNINDNNNDDDDKYANKEWKRIVIFIKINSFSTCIVCFFLALALSLSLFVYILLFNNIEIFQRYRITQHHKCAYMHDELTQERPNATPYKSVCDSRGTKLQNINEMKWRKKERPTMNCTKNAE